VAALLLQGLDVAVIVVALASAYLWWKASGRPVRRVSRKEELDVADVNRIVTALNRAQLLNARAALATATATVLAGLRLILAQLGV
jgi:hypothetical protein